jgi:large subunit ribosomal protein L19
LLSVLSCGILYLARKLFGLTDAPLEVSLDHVQWDNTIIPKGDFKMNKQLVQQITATQIRHDLPEFEIGDTVKVMVTIREGNKERQQAFEGVVLSIRGAGASKSFIVRKDSAGVGVERNFLANSPVIASMSVLRHGKVRRHKLYFLRQRSGKAARLKEVIKK